MTVESNKVVHNIKKWRQNHPDLYEFIMFNLMSNIATITNFVVLWCSGIFLSKMLEQQPFQWFIFNYSNEDGGLSAFISFLLAYICAQIVNFIVQRKVVFGSTSKLGSSLPWYILTVIVAGIISIWLPPYVISMIKPFVGDWAPMIANALNIMIQVLINYPMMKFVIMKK